MPRRHTTPSRACLVALSAAILACAPSGHGATPAEAAAVSTAASLSSAAPCAPAGTSFCWLNPLPQGSTIAGAWLASADRGWAVGPTGSLLRWDGSGLVATSIPTLAPLRAVWGSSAADVWAVGDAVLHHDGSAWTIAPGASPGSWSAVHGSSASDVWMVGAAGSVAHYDGLGWARVPSGTSEDLTAVAAPSAGEAYAATASGVILRWDGSSWSPAARLAARSLSALFAAGPGDVWAGGEALDVNASAGALGTALAHLVAGVWQAVVVPGLETSRFTAITGTSAADVWVLGVDGSGAGRAAHLVAGSWEVEALPAPALAPRGGSAVPGLVLAVGDGGQAFVRGTASWSAIHHGTPGYLQAAAISPAADVWFAAVLPGGEDRPQAELLHVVGGAVSTVPVGVADVVYGVWANAPDDVWAGTLQNGFLHFDGSSWTSRVGGYAGLVDGVWASGPSDVWGVAGDGAIHFDGATVTRYSLPAGGARRIFGFSARDVWAVGGAGVVHHWDGTSWMPLTIPGGPALGVWGSSADDVWLVGTGGLALHWDGAALARVDTGTTATLWAVGGSAGNDVWAAGADGTALHFDGRAFAMVPSGTRNALAAVAVSAAGDVYLGGDFGTILRKAR